jgi:palmitoyltransferase ZDHHC2/15/20
MTTDPGSVPREATPLPDDEEALANGGSGMEEGKCGGDGHGANGGGGSGSGSQRRVRKYCRRCNAFKPPRAHHCSICRRCVIKMDRECVHVCVDGWGEEGGELVSWLVDWQTTKSENEVVK